METITLLPHHARNVLIAYMGRDRGTKPGDRIAYYNDDMKKTDIRNITSILNNPNQPVRVVSTYDSLCEQCPLNENSINYTSGNSGCNHNYDGGVDPIWAKKLGLDKYVDGDAITASQLLNSIQENYTVKKSSERLVNKIIRKIFNN